MNGESVDCPHSGKGLPGEELNEIEFSIPEDVKCPWCGSRKLWRDGTRETLKGERLQRYFCQDCFYRFSKW